MEERDKCKTGATSHPRLPHQGRKTRFQISLSYCPPKERKPSNCPLHGNRNSISTPFSLFKETHFILIMPISNGLLLPIILLLLTLSPNAPVLGQQSFNRPDPLQHFRPYHGDFDVRNRHYWAVCIFFSCYEVKERKDIVILGRFEWSFMWGCIGFLVFMDAVCGIYRRSWICDGGDLDLGRTRFWDFYGCEESDWQFSRDCREIQVSFVLLLHIFYHLCLHLFRHVSRTLCCY